MEVLLMLKHLTYHYQFKNDLKVFRDSLSFSDAKRLRARAFKQALFKIIHINLDHIHPLISQLYSPVGRPAIHQIEIFRSILLMNHFGYTSISKWIDLQKPMPCMPLFVAFSRIRIWLPWAPTTISWIVSIWIKTMPLSFPKIVIRNLNIK